MLRAIYERIVETAPDAAPYVAVIGDEPARAHPWEALRLPLTISRQTQDTLISSTDMGLVGEILFGDIERHAVRSVGAPAASLRRRRAGHASSRASPTLSSGIVKEVEMRRDGRWGQRLLKDRAAVAE
jgi:hypothetical protein